MTKNRYSGVDAYAAFFIGYKAKTLTRMPIFTPDDFEDLQQELMVAYLHAWPSFDPARGDRRSFVKTVVNTRALMLVREAEAQKRWTGAKTLSLSAPVDEDGDIALGDTIGDPMHLIMEQNADMAMMVAAKDITQMEEVLFIWMRWLEVEERRLVWRRSERVRWKQICAELGIGRTKAWEIYRCALGKIAVHA